MAYVGNIFEEEEDTGRKGRLIGRCCDEPHTCPVEAEICANEEIEAKGWNRDNCCVEIEEV